MATTEIKPTIQAAASRHLTLHDILEMLFRRRYVVAVVLLLCVGAGIYLATWPRRYTAQGEIRIELGATSEFHMSIEALFGGSSDKIQSDTIVMQNRTLYLQVAKELDLANSAAFWGKKNLPHQSLDDPYVREKLYRLMTQKIDIIHNPKDDLIFISCTTTSPDLSAKIVNTLINDYIAYVFQMRYGSTHRASNWIIDQLSTLKREIDSEQADLTALQQRLGVISTGENSAHYLQSKPLDSISLAASNASVDRIAAEAKLRFLENANPELIEGEVNMLSSQQSVPNGLLQGLRKERAQAASDYASLRAQYGPNYPEVKKQKAQLDELQKQVDAEQQRVLNQAKTAYEAANKNEKMIGAELKAQQNEVFKTGGEMGRYILLQSDYKAKNALYEGLIQRLSEAGITAGLEAGEVDVVSLADLPVIPNLPGPILTIAASVIAGLLLGSLVALGVTALDTRVGGPDQVQQILSLPMLAQVPHHKVLKPDVNRDKPAMLMSLEKGPFRESMQALRTSILLGKAGSPPKTILVTSSIPNEGKSTVAVFLAAVFARHNARVLLCDCDLHKGLIAARLGMKGAKGLSNVLTRQASLESVIQQVPGAPGFFFLPAGPPSPDPAVLVGSEEMRKLIDECKEQFDFVIIDSPPVLGISDAIHLGHLVDSAFLVIRENVSRRKAVTESATLMTSMNLPMSGYVFNDIGLHSSGYGYGYGYGYTYGTYYGASSDGSE